MSRHKSWNWKKKKDVKHEGRPAPRSPEQLSAKHAHTPKPHGPEKAHEIVEGFLQMKANFGFVLSETSLVPDVMVAGPSLKLAMGGDRVRAKVTSVKDGRRSGEIVEVITRAHQTVVGSFRRLGNLPVVVPDDEGQPVHLSDLGSFVPHVGDVVTARIESWPTAQQAAQGVLIEVIGPRDAAGVDLTTLVRKYELPDAFPDEVTSEANHFCTDVPDSACQERETFFDKRVFTIDGADAKDFDDAVHIEHLPEGAIRLGVHIADVAHYVREGTPLDEEAYRRGTSVYLSGTVIPMLPFPLSDNLCSLRPDRIRLTLSCLIDIDSKGHVISARVLESAIKSARRFTYDEVDTILKGEHVENVTPQIASDVRDMGQLAKRLQAQRFGRGSLDFDFPEPEVVTGLDGKPLDIRRRNRLESHRLVEDFMLLANESVARHMRNHPFLYRIHETPDPAKMEKLQKSLELMGLQLPQSRGELHPSTLQQVIKQSDGKPFQPMVHMMVLRSLKQAVYSPANKGHFGLASECYTHFTSPIRRYPDLVVHRIVKEGLHHKSRDSYWKQQLPQVAGHTSRRERVAVDAEREYLDVQKVRLMESRVGQTFDGVISSVTNFGLFVQLTEFFVEGLVHVTNLGKDYFIYDEARMTLRGRSSGQTFAMGQKVKVLLAAASPLKRQLDFQLLSSETGKPVASKTPHPQQQTHATKPRPEKRHRRRHR